MTQSNNLLEPNIYWIVYGIHKLQSKLTHTSALALPAKKEC